MFFYEGDFCKRLTKYRSLRLSHCVLFGLWLFASLLNLEGVDGEGVTTFVSSASASEKADEIQDPPRSNLSSSIESLQARANREPLNAGVRLDLFLAFCQLGRLDLARQTVEELEALGPLPPGVQALIGAQLQSGCQANRLPRYEIDRGGTETKTAHASRISYVSGWQDNVNAAPKSEGLWLGDRGDLGYFIFDSDSRPKSSYFWELAGSRELGFYEANWLSGLGLTQSFFKASVHAAARDYLSQSSFDTVYFGTELALVFEPMHYLALDASRWWLGGEAYEQLTGLTYGLPQPWIGEYGAMSIRLEASRLYQATAFNSQRMELQWGRKPPRKGLEWALAFSVDQGTNDRPGGDRTGSKLTLGWHDSNSLGSLSAIAEASLARDAQPYNLLLFGGVKRQSRKFNASVRQTLPKFKGFKQLQPYILLRHSQSTDTIELFSVTSHFYQLGLEQSF